MLSATERIYLEMPEQFEKEKGKNYAKKIRSMIRRKLSQACVDISLIANYNLKIRERLSKGVLTVYSKDNPRDIDVFSFRGIRNISKTTMPDEHDVEQCMTWIGAEIYGLQCLGKKDHLKMLPWTREKIMKSYYKNR